MSELEKDYLKWDTEPTAPISDENRISFLVWAIWDSGDPIAMWFRLVKLERVETVRKWLELGFAETFSREELEYATLMLNDLLYPVRDELTRYIETKPFNERDIAQRLQRIFGTIIACGAAGQFDAFKPKTLRPLPVQESRALATVATN